MKLVFVVFLILFAVPGVSAPPTVGIQHVAWLQGCWELNSSGTTIEEQWMAPRGKSMVGASRTVREDSLVSYELVVIREQGDGLVYKAHPSGQPSAEFPLDSVNDSSIVFENLDHDFPQRIGYHLVSPDSLHAWIEGSINGSERRIDFSYHRAGCSGN